MLRIRQRSWRRRGCPEAVDQPQDVTEQSPWDRDLGELEGDIATVANHLGTDFDQLLPQRGQRPVVDLLRQGQCLLRVKPGSSPGSLRMTGVDL